MRVIPHLHHFEGKGMSIFFIVLFVGLFSCAFGAYYQRIPRERRLLGMGIFWAVLFFIGKLAEFLCG